MRKALFVLGAMCIVQCVGCGGGGGSSQTGLPPLPSRGVFTMAGGPFTGSFSEAAGGPAISATASSLNLTGAFDTSTETWTVDSGAGKGLRVDTVDLFDPMEITVTTAMTLPFSGHASGGAFRVVTANMQITVAVDNTAPAGVIVSQTSPLPQAQAKLSWAQFGDTQIVGTAPLYQRMAAMAWQTLAFAMYDLSRQAWWIQIIARNEAGLEQAGSGRSVQEAGEYCPPAGTAGNLTVGWTDSPTVEPIGKLGQADNFTLTFNNWWRSSNTSSDTRNYASGTMTLGTFQAAWSPRNLGFAGVSYDHVVVKDVEKSTSGTYSYVSSVTITGGYSVSFNGT